MVLVTKYDSNIYYMHKSFHLVLAFASCVYNRHLDGCNISILSLID